MYTMCTQNRANYLVNNAADNSKNKEIQNSPEAHEDVYFHQES